MPTIEQRRQKLVDLLRSSLPEAAVTGGPSPGHLRGGRPSIEVILASVAPDGAASWQLDLRLPDEWPARRRAGGRDGVSAVVDHLRAILESDSVSTIGAGAPGPGDISWRQLVTDASDVAPTAPVRIVRSLTRVATSGGSVSAGRTDLGPVVLEPGPWEPGFPSFVSGPDGTVDAGRVLALQPTVLLEEPLPIRLDPGWSLWSVSDPLNLQRWSRLDTEARLHDRQRLPMQDGTIRIYTDGTPPNAIVLGVTVKREEVDRLDTLTDPWTPPGRFLLSGPDRRPWSLLRTWLETQEGMGGLLELVLKGEGSRAASLDPFSSGGLE